MTTKILQNLHIQNGKYLVMPPEKAAQLGWGNMQEPNVHLAGGDGIALYPVHTKFIDFDRTHIYGYCSAKANAAVKSNVAMFNDNKPIIGCTWGDVAGVAGDTLLPFLTSDLTNYTTVTVNQFAGGLIMPRASNIAYGDYRIVSNTVYDGGINAGGDETDFIIEEPGLQAAVPAAAAYCYIDRNPYTALASEWLGSNRYGTMMGITLIDPTASTYQWIQTYGFVHVLGGEQAGVGVDLRQQYVAQDGSFIAGVQGDHTATFQPQIAGHIVANTEGGVYGALLLLKCER